MGYILLLFLPAFLLLCLLLWRRHHVTVLSCTPTSIPHSYVLYAPLHLSSGSGLLRPSRIFSVPSFRYSSLSSLHRFWNEYFAYPLPNGSNLLHRLMVQILHLCIVHTLFIPRIHIQPDRLATLSPIALPNIKSSEIVSSSYRFAIRVLLSHSTGE